MKIAFYRSLPPWAQRAVRQAFGILPLRWRLGRTYWGTREFLLNARGWDRPRIDEWQWSEFRRILRHAYENTAGYRQLYTEAGVTPQDVRSWQDVGRLPFVTKELLRDNLEEFSAKNLPPHRRLYRTTGGSTGVPFGFYLVQDNIERELAFLHAAWERAGWRFGFRSIVLRGAFIGSEQEHLSIDPVLNEWKVSAYYLSERTYGTYRETMVRSRAEALQAYPSSATILADLVRAHGDGGHLPFSILLLGSENLYDWQRKKLREVFPAARQFSWYGHAEQVLFAPACEASDRLHLDPFYGYAELLKRDGSPAAAGESGELVGTSFWNVATPFIRYRTADIAVADAEACDACGRPFRLLGRIDGRLQELLVTGTGRYISMTQINMHSPVFDDVKQFQFRQTERGSVELQIVPKPSFTEASRTGIEQEIGEKLGRDMRLRITLVETIPLTKSGKRRFLVQELALPYGDHDA